MIFPLYVDFIRRAISELAIPGIGGRSGEITARAASEGGYGFCSPYLLSPDGVISFIFNLNFSLTAGGRRGFLSASPMGKLL